MKILAILAMVVIIGVPHISNAQTMNRLNTGKMVLMTDKSPVCWGIGGIPIINIRACAGNLTPMDRSMVYDARTVEILSKCVNNPLHPKDFKVQKWNRHIYIVVRDDFLAEVLPQDAAATGMSQMELANEWAKSVRKAFMRIEPIQNKKGV